MSCKHVLAAVAAVVVIAVASHSDESGAQPALATGPDAEITGDGLHRVDPSVMGAAWVRPDLDLSRYGRIYLMPAAVQFRDVPDRRYNARSMGTAESFHVDEQTQGRFRELFGESFHEVFLGTTSFEVTGDVGRDVLLVRGFLTDVISGDPPNVVGSSIGDIGWAWEATVVLELRDSMSDDVLARTADRRRVEGPFAVGTISSVVTPRVAQNWSVLLAQRLEELIRVSRD